MKKLCARGEKFSARLVIVEEPGHGDVLAIQFIPAPRLGDLPDREPPAEWLYLTRAGWEFPSRLVRSDPAVLPDIDADRSFAARLFRVLSKAIRR